MKTININLIGFSRKAVKSASVFEDGDAQETKYRIISIVAVAGAFVLFTILAGATVLSSMYSQSMKIELDKTSSKNLELSGELSKFIKMNKDMLAEKGDLAAKMVINKELEKVRPSWNKILIDLSRSIPKGAKITEINEINSSSSDMSTSSIEIKGQIKPDLGQKPLTLISYFVININDNPVLNSSMENATIKKVEKDEKTDIFEFTINTDIKRPVSDTSSGKNNE